MLRMGQRAYVTLNFDTSSAKSESRPREVSVGKIAIVASLVSSSCCHPSSAQQAPLLICRVILLTFLYLASLSTLARSHSQYQAGLHRPHATVVNSSFFTLFKSQWSQRNESGAQGKPSPYNSFQVFIYLRKEVQINVISETGSSLGEALNLYRQWQISEAGRRGSFRRYQWHSSESHLGTFSLQLPFPSLDFNCCWFSMSCW